MADRVSRIERAIIGTFFALILMVLFNQKLNELVGLSSSFEAKIMLRAGILAVFIVMATLFPVGLAKPDKTGGIN